MRAMAMGSVLALVAFLAVCSADPVTIACGSCPSPTPRRTPVITPPVTVPPVTVPPVTVPPVTVPPVVGLPPVITPPVTTPPSRGSPVTVPPVRLPPVTVPPVTVPPVVKLPPVTVPPVTVPPVTVPPVTGGTPPSSSRQGGGCPSPPATTGSSTCPMLKLGTCLDVLGQTINIGDPAVECCAPLAGLAGVDAALCLCTTIRARLLNMDLVIPVALQLLVDTCGKSIPPGYTCPN